MKKFISCMIAIFAISNCSINSYAFNDTSKVLFEGTTIDENGYFDIQMSVFNAEFNAFQFALYYDDSTVIPVDENGNETNKFGKFSEKLDDGWMSTIGTIIDTENNIIDFTGYVNPNESVAVDNEPKTGKAIIGETGIKLFNFNFKKISDKPVKLTIASKDSGLPYRDYLPDGARIADAGISSKITVEFNYQNNIGKNLSITIDPNLSNDTSDDNSSNDNNNTSTDKPTTDNTEQSGNNETSTDNSQQTQDETDDKTEEITVDDLLDHSILLKIDSHAAIVNGGVTAIYTGEKNVTAYINNNRTYVPIRFVAERMGADVDWDNKTQTVIIKKDGKTIKMTIGSANYTVDGQLFTIDSAAELKDSRTRVPIRFVADALGYQVEWDEVHNMVIIGDNIVKWDLNSKITNDTLDKADNLLLMYSSFV